MLNISMDLLLEILLPVITLGFIFVVIYFQIMYSKKRFKWTPGMIAAMKQFIFNNKTLHKSVSQDDALRFAEELSKEWGSKWIHDWATSQSYSMDKLIKWGKKSLKNNNLTDDDALEAVFIMAAASKILGIVR